MSNYFKLLFLGLITMGAINQAMEQKKESKIFAIAVLRKQIGDPNALLQLMGRLDKPKTSPYSYRSPREYPDSLVVEQKSESKKAKL